MVYNTAEKILNYCKHLSMYQKLHKCYLDNNIELFWQYVRGSLSYLDLGQHQNGCVFEIFSQSTYWIKNTTHFGPYVDHTLKYFILKNCIHGTFVSTHNPNNPRLVINDKTIVGSNKALRYL